MLPPFVTNLYSMSHFLTLGVTLVGKFGREISQPVRLAGDDLF
jgi:hypothetical protein